MSKERLAELDRLIAHWRTILTVARNKAARPGATKDDHDSVTYAAGKVDQYLDQRLAITGVDRGPAPRCNSGPCTQITHHFGTRTWLCPECDFRECVACRERVHSLTAVICPNCEFTVGAPGPVDDVG